jgi:hypothetical protein
MTRMKQATYVAAAFLALGVSGSLHAQKPAAGKPAPKAAPVAARVYLTPTCGCCSKWVDHMTAAGFDMPRDVMVQAELDKVAARQKVPVNLRSCHTAVVGKYVIEGHVPADVVRQLLKDAPATVVGLSAPNMPVGSPGMEGPNAKPYSIMAFKADGSTYEYAKR